jgi:type II secretion system protein N
MPQLDAFDTNLVRTSKSASKNAAKEPVIAPKTKSNKGFLKKLAYVLIFLWALVTFTLVKIPDTLVTNVVLNNLNQNTPYQWQAERIGIGLFPAPHLQMLKLSLDPKNPGAGPALQVDELRIYPNPLSLIPIGGGVALGGSFRAEAYKAVLHGSFSMGKNISFRVYADSVDLSKISPLVAYMPTKGNIQSLDVSLSMPGQKLSNANGKIDIAAKNVQVDPSNLGLPVVLPLLSVGDVNVEGTLTHGQLKVEKFKVGGSGKDLDLQIPNGQVTLADVAMATRYDLHVQLKPSAALEKAVPGFGSTIGVFATQKPDGYYATRIQGTLGSPGFPVRE